MPNPAYPRLEQDAAAVLQFMEDLRKIVATHRKKLGDDVAHDCEERFSALRDGITALRNASRASLSELMNQYQELVKIANELQEKLLILTSPPFGIVSFVRLIRMVEMRDEDAEETRMVPLIEVKDAHGDVAWVYFTDEKTSVAKLAAGQHLVVQGQRANHVLEATNEFATDTVIGSIVEVLSPDRHGARFLVSTTEQGAPFIMHAGALVDLKNLEKGTRVLIDQTARLVEEVLPEEETSERFLIPEVPDVTFDDIGGLEDTKRSIMEDAIYPIMFPTLMERLDEPRPKGIALAGPPGNAKTMFAKAIANRIYELWCEQAKRSGRETANEKPPFFNVNGPELLSKWIGEGEKDMRRLFAQARRMAERLKSPVFIFFDEAESFLPVRGSGISSDTEKTMVPMFTSLVDGLEGLGNVIIILASNRIDLMDSAALRPGRCDCIVTVPRPDEKGAIAILDKYLNPTWEVLHPKYNMDVYTPLDGSGKSKTDEHNQVIRHQFGCDPARVREYLVGHAVKRIFDKSPRSVVMKLRYEGSPGHEQTIYFHNLVSGARLANIVRRAKKSARRRFTDSLEKQGLLSQANELAMLDPAELMRRELEPLGVKLKDLYDAIEREFAEVQVPASSSRELEYWLLIEGLVERNGANRVSVDVVRNRDVPHDD